MTPRIKRTYTNQAVAQVLQAAGIPFSQQGKEIQADILGTGHNTHKINPRKGLYLDTSSGKGGTVAALLRSLGQSPAPLSPRPAAGGQDRDTRGIAQRIWQSAWTCTHAQDLPAGWEKGLSTNKKMSARARHEAERTAVITYLSARIGPEHLNHWLRQTRVARARDGQIMMIAPMHTGGRVQGIQRTYLTPAGKKIERKMLGAHGVMALPVPQGVQARDLGTGGPCMLIGEGFETVAAAVQAAGWPGVCTYDAGGMIKWAEAQADKSQNLAPEQVQKAPVAIILVDRDNSSTGQNACARAVQILQDAGLKAHFALPPLPQNGGPQGSPKGSDWGDYPRECITNEALVTHLAAAVSNGDREMPMPTPPAISLQSWRPAANPEAPVATQPTSEVREKLQTELQKTVASYLVWLDKESEERGRFAPVLFMPTTGTGKSTSVKKLIFDMKIRENGARVCVFVPDHAQASEYEDAGFFHFWGRNPEPTHPGYCPNHEQMSEAMEKGHISQAEFCRQCSNGQKWSLDTNEKLLAITESDDPRREKLINKIAASESILRARGLDPAKVDPCVWQTHLRDAIAAQFVVAASGSYSHSLVGDSLAIFDEHFEGAKSTNVTLQDIDHWSRRNQQAIENLENFGTNQDALGRHQNAARFFQQLAQSLAQWIGKTGAITVDPDLLNAVQGILDASKSRSGDDVELADWERLQFTRSGELSDAPLRAAFAIAESLRYGDGYVDKGNLVVAASLPVVERIAQGKPTIIMDATPDPVILDIVQAQGGKVINAIASQNLKIVRHPTRFWGLTPLNPKRSGQQRVDCEVGKYKALMQHHQGAAFIFHKKARDQIDPKGESPALGYWGRDHRAHNRFTNKDLVIVGGFFPPIEAQRSMYQASRIAALAGGADPQNWPAWPDNIEMQTGQWICEGSDDVQCRLPLPADPHIRQWILNRTTAETVQAIGRARGANADREITVHIYGGVPLAGLGDHGLQVAEYAPDPDCLGQTRANWNQAQADAATGRVMAAITALGDVAYTSYRKVMDWLKSHGLPQCRYDVWERLVKENKERLPLGKETIYQGVDRITAALNLLAADAQDGALTLPEQARRWFQSGHLTEVERFAAEIILSVTNLSLDTDQSPPEGAAVCG